MRKNEAIVYQRNASSNTPELVRVIHLDDEEDQQLFLKVFIEGDPNIKVTSAKNADDALLLAQTDAYDCIVSDYDMPDMNGIDLAKKIRETSQIPIILYTGRGSEEIAEQAFAIGINDYIRKENHPAHYQVLAKRIRHTVEKSRAEKSLRESEERYKALVEYSPYAFSVTVGDKIVYANPSRAKLAGVDDASKLIGTNSQLQVADEDKPMLIRRSKMRSRDITPVLPFSFRLVSPDGGIRYVVDYSSEIMYEGVKAVQHMLMDTTEHRLFVERLETVRRSGVEVAYAESLDDAIELTLDAFERTLGFDRCFFGVVEGDVLRFKHTRGVEGVVELPLSGRGITVRAVRTGEAQFVPDVRMDADFVEAVDDSFLVLSEMAVPVRVGENIVGVINLESSKLDAYTFEDMKLVEILAENVSVAVSRFNFIKTIMDSEETYKTLLNCSTELIALVTGTKIGYVNDWAVKLLGYDSQNDLVGLDISKVIPIEVLPLIRERALSRQRGESQPGSYELKLLARDGRVVPVDVSVSLITREGVTSILVVGHKS